MNEALDSFKIAQLLGAFLRAPPYKAPQQLETWQVEQLLVMAQAVFTGQAGLLDSIGSLYCICFYCGTSPKFEDDRVLSACALLLQTVATECLYVIQLGIRDGVAKDAVHIVHPVHAFLKENIRTLPKVDLYEVLLDAYDLARDIVRDIKDQIRNSHEPGMQKKDDYKDGFYAHSMYLMCSFGLAHIGLTLKMSNNYNAIPGMTEALLLISLSACTPDPPVVTEELVSPSKNALKGIPAKSLLKSKANVFYEESRLPQCMTIAAALATAVVLFSLDERTIQEIRLVRTRLSRRFTHPDIGYASDMSAPYASYLEEENIRYLKLTKDQQSEEISSPKKNDSISVPRIDPSTSIIPTASTIPIYRAGMLLSVGGHHYNEILFIRPESRQKAVTQLIPVAPVQLNSDDWMSTAKSLTIRDESHTFDEGQMGSADIGMSVDDGGGSALEEGTSTVATNGESAKSYHSKNTNGSKRSKLSRIGPPSIQSKKAKKLGLSSPTPSHMPLIDESMLLSYTSVNAKMDEPYRIKRHFREAYTVTEAVRHRLCIKPYLPTNYQPKFFPIRIRSITAKIGLSRQELVRCGDQIESAYYCVDNFAVPRHLNPSCGAYWLCQQLIEFLYQKTVRNEGFKRSTEAVVAELKGEVRTMKESRLLKTMDHIRISYPSPSTSTSLVPAVPLIAPSAVIPASSMSSQNKSKQTVGIVPVTSTLTSNAVTILPPITSAVTKTANGTTTTTNVGGVNPKHMNDRIGQVPGTKSKSAPLTLMEKLKIASAEAKAEVQLLELERKVQKAELEHQHEILIHQVDRTLLDGLTTLKKIKTQQARNINTTSNTWTTVNVSQRSNSASPQQKKKNKLYDPVQQFLSDPNVREIEHFRSAMRKTGIIDKTDADDPPKPTTASLNDQRSNTPVSPLAGLLDIDVTQPKIVPVISIFWTKPPGAKKHPKEKVDPEEETVSNEDAKEYIKNIIDYQRGQRDLVEEQKLFVQYKMDKDAKAFEERNEKMMVEKRELAKAQAKANQMMLTKLLEDKKSHMLEQRRLQKKEREQKKEEARAFSEHVREIHMMEMEKEEEEYLQHLQELDDEKEKIDDVWARLLHRDNVRRIHEENRMRFLENMRREADRRAAEAKAKKMERIIKLREQSSLEIEKNVSKIRMGNFVYVHGKMGFYNDVRPEPVPWVAFVHPDGKPTYYDPLTHKVQRKLPTDAPVIDAEPDDIRWRDVIYGPGSYEKWISDNLFKDSYNADGGYFDDDGNWVVATGYYEWRSDEYVFVQYDGFYDAKGRYILYPKPVGDTKFMV